MHWTEGVVDALAEPFVVLDASLRVVALNRAAEGLVGVSSADCVGRPAHEALPFLQGKRVADALRQALGDREAAAPEFPVRSDDPEAAVWLEARAVPWKNTEGAVGGVVLFLSDVTRRRREAMLSRALTAVGRSLSSSLDLNEVLDTIAARSVEVMGADAVMVIGWDGEAPTFTVLRAAGRFSREYIAAGSIAAGRGPIYHAVKEARPVTTANILTDPEMSIPPERRREIEVEGFRAVAAAPLAAKGRVYGALVAHYWHERAFADDEITTLARLAEQAAIAIDNARLYGEATRRAERLRELAEVEELASGSLVLEDVLRRVAEATGRLLDAPVAQVWIVDRETGALERWAISITAAIAEATLPTTIAAHDPLTRVLAKERAIVYVADVAREPLGASMGWAPGFGLPALLAVPITDGEQLVGALTVHGRAWWRPGGEDRGVVVSLAARVARTLEGARAYRDAVRRGERLSHLVAVTQSISASLDTTAVIQGIADAAAGLILGASAVVHVYDRDAGVLRTLAISGKDVKDLPPEFPADRGLPGLVVGQRRPVLVREPDVEAETLARDWRRAHPRATYFGVPIVAGDAFLGVLDFVVPDRSPSVEEQELLQLLAAHAGIAIQNAALYESERHQGERIRALAEVNRRISSALELDELLQTIAESAAHLTGVPFASFWLADDRTRTLTLMRGSHAVPVADFPRRVIPYGLGGTGIVAETRMPLVVDDISADPRIVHGDWWRQHGFSAFAAYPVIAGAELLAILVFAHSQPLRLGPGGQGMIDLFTAQAAVAIQNARLYAESQRERREAAALAAAARRLAASLDVDDVARQLVEVLHEFFSAHASALYRVREDGALVSVAFGGAARAHMRSGEPMEPRVGIVRRALERRHAVWTRDVLNDPDVYLTPEFRAAIVASGNRAILAVPLIAKNEAIGVLAIAYGQPRDFDAREAGLLQAFADQAALALENARLYASARDSLARLRETQAQLVQAGKLTAVGQLVSGVAHELNNPLSVVIGYGQLLLGRDLPPAIRRPVELMVSQGDRMAKIVRGLLFFARQRPPERAPVRINEVIEDTLALRLNQLALSGIAVDRRLSPELPPISGDAHQLQQVFLNLFLNAEQAILETGKAGRILVRTAFAGEGRAIRAEIVDDGPGIPANALPHVFEPFFTTKEVGAGTGLGLSVSYGIVQEHGGRLSVESRPGETVFTVELPVAAVREAARTPAPAPPSPMSAEGRLALVVEDEPAVSDLVVALLRDEGWRVDVAGGGRPGLERLRARRYDLIVTDVRMPDVNGEELYRRATTEDPALAGRFVFITGDTANADAWRFLQGTKAPVLEKPFSPAVFLDAVRRLTTSLTPSTSSA